MYVVNNSSFGQRFVTVRAGFTIKQNKHVLRASTEGESLFYGLLLFFILNYIYMGAPKSFKCLGPLWVLTRPW